MAKNIAAKSKRKSPVPKKKKLVKLCFIQDWGTFTMQTLVCIGMTYNEIVAEMKKRDLNGIKDFIKENEDEKDYFDIGNNHQSGMFWHCENRSVLWLEEFKDDWNFYETLMHEVHHAVQCLLADRKSMSEEIEALAYQQEFLFHNIRRTIQKFFLPISRLKKSK